MPEPCEPPLTINPIFAYAKPYDLIGFQTAMDLVAFQDDVIYEAAGSIGEDGRLTAFGRTICAGVFPIGIDATIGILGW